MRAVIREDRCALVHGDCLELLRAMRPDSIDALVTDPPSGIGFMGKTWDSDKGGRDAWIEWLAGILREAYRVMKPGAHGLVWALPRTSHWTAMACELAGFEVRDRVSHLFGTGFPKSLDVSKAIDAAAGATRTKTGEDSCGSTAGMNTLGPSGIRGGAFDRHDVAATAAAAAWQGWGTALKPACEDWWLIRKPLGTTVAACVLAHGTGALNVDACRIGGGGEVFHVPQSNPANRTHGEAVQPGATSDVEKMQEAQRASPSRLAAMGRWPANTVLSHDPRCVAVGEGVEEIAKNIEPAGERHGEDWGPRKMRTENATTTTTVYACVAGCAVRALDEQAGERKSGTMAAGTSRGTNAVFGKAPRSAATDRGIKASAGGASRFFYCAKPSKAETEAGLDHLPLRTGGDLTDREDGSDGLNSPRAGAGRGGGRRNTHPTKKSIALMRYLVRLVTPPGGVVLDPFAGTGTTGIAALAEGYRFVGAELTDEYVPIVEGRLRHALDSVRRPVIQSPEGDP